MAIPIAEVEADYYEAFELDSTADTLSSILLALVIGSAITVLLATGVGIWTSRRLVQPLGRSPMRRRDRRRRPEHRVALEGDPDLDRLVNSFNDMADAVQADRARGPLRLLT